MDFRLYRTNTTTVIDDRQVVLHKGIYKPTATTAEAVFMITGMTIGAGILGIPYVVAEVGAVIGVAYILVLGFVMLFLNLMIGEIAARTPENLQLPGLAGKYLGGWAKRALSATLILGGGGALLAYIVGEGQALSAILGGDAFVWSIVFWSIASAFIAAGLQRVKTAEKFLSAAVMIMIGAVVIMLAPFIRTENLLYSNMRALFVPYGVILFALHGAPAIAEARALLPGEPRRFRKALIIGTIIPIILYILFAIAVVGVSGRATTPVATLGLSERFGASAAVLANLFAIFAMSTAFMGLGTALKETLVWDFRLSNWWGTLLVVGVPLLLFLAGFNNFVSILTVVGGLFIALEAIIMVLVYWRARAKGVLSPFRYGARAGWLMSLTVLAVFSAVAIRSVLTLFF